MNVFRFRALVYRLLATEALSVDSTIQRLRRDYRDAIAGVKGSQLEALVNSIESEVRAAESAGQLMFDALALQYDEIGLRGELHEAVSALPALGPRAVRTHVACLQSLMSRESTTGHDAPAEMQAAVQLLDEADALVVEAYRVRLSELYPAA